MRGKRYFAVGFPNVSGGYETRSRRFKGCVPPKDVSLVKAAKIPPKIRVFSFLMLMCFMMTYIVIIVYQIINSLGSLF